MNAFPLLQPKEVTITDDDSVIRTYIISKFTAVAGREIISKYTMSNLPKVGDYQVSEDTMFKLMNYVAVPSPKGPLRLSTRELVDNHVVGWGVLIRIEKMMIEYNNGFFKFGTILDFCLECLEKIQARISEMSIKSSEPSSPDASPPSTN